MVVVGTRRRTGLSRLASISGGALHFGRMAVACIPATIESEHAADIPSLRRVLVATDLSDLANRAVRYAYALARDGEGEVILLHVSGRAAGDPDSDAELVARLRKLVPSSVEETATRTEVVHSHDVVEAICAAAERLGVDAICVASHGRTGLARAVLGSVAERVIREARRPVLVVRSPDA